MSTIINWRDVQPVISHESAIIWSCLQPKSTDGGHGDTRAQVEVLESLGGLTVHAIQGRKASDYHKHANREQLY